MRGLCRVGWVAGPRVLIICSALVVACTSGSSSDATVTTLTAPPETSTIPQTTTTAELASATSTTTTVRVPRRVIGYQVFEVPAGSRPHDVAPAGDGTVWYTAQGTGHLGRLDPATGEVTEIALGPGSAPHGVIVGPDGAAWVTDGGLDAIVRVEPVTGEVEVFPIGRRGARLNTAAFDGHGVLWFTGQSGVYGSFDPASQAMEVFEAPGGAGPYGIAATPRGEVFYASLAGSHIARIDSGSGAAQRIDPPTADQGARRVWSDSQGVIWVAEWNTGQVSRYDPSADEWREWRLPGEDPRAYAVYVDETDTVWLSDFGGDHALVRFEPVLQRFDRFPLPHAGGAVRQLLGVAGEVWGAQSATDSLIVLRYEG